MSTYVYYSNSQVKNLIEEPALNLFSARQLSLFLLSSGLEEVTPVSSLGWPSSWSFIHKVRLAPGQDPAKTQRSFSDLPAIRSELRPTIYCVGIT